MALLKTTNKDQDSANSKFLKINPDSSAKIRVIGPQIEGYEYWDQSGKAFVSADYPQVDDPNLIPRYFWAVPIFNYDAGCVQIWRIPQKGIRETLTEIDNETGDLSSVTLKVSRVGSTRNDTRYTVIALKSSPFEYPDALREAREIKMQALLSGANPFEGVIPARLNKEEDALCEKVEKLWTSLSWSDKDKKDVIKHMNRLAKTFKELDKDSLEYLADVLQVAIDHEMEFEQWVEEVIHKTPF